MYSNSPKIIGSGLGSSVLLSAIVLLSVYVILSFEIVHRTAMALLGGTLILIIDVLIKL